MNWSAASGVLLPALLGACWQVTRPSSPTFAPETEPVEAAVLPSAASSAAVVDEAPTTEVFAAAPPVKVGPALHISEVAGVAPAAAGAFFAPAVEALERCQTSSTGKLVLRVVAEPGSTHVRVVDPGGLDASTNRCALSALGTLEVDDAIQQSWSRVDSVRRVETQVVISW